MLDFIATLPTYAQDEATKTVWAWLKSRFDEEDGVCFYKHPVMTNQNGIKPELTLFTPTYQPLVIRCFSDQLDAIQDVSEDSWIIDEKKLDSPLLELEDFVVSLRSKFDKDRVIRNRIQPIAVLAFPLIAKSDFEQKFGGALNEACVIWANGDLSEVASQANLPKPLSEDEWRLIRSTVQGVSSLKRAQSTPLEEPKTIGEAIKYLDRKIALLDKEQEKAALQIAPGPQRIRGLAGTGKTVLLAMKAASIHSHFPEKKLLFTFNTHSLYRQVEKLISQFYRENNDTSPDWEMLHVRHAWGGRTTVPGVYFDLCNRLEIEYLDFNEAKRRNKNTPFQSCCQQILDLAIPIQPEYDFILVDEAQDFSKEFFQILYKLSLPPHQIYWVYDELQSLNAEWIPKPEELFGSDEKGKPFVSLGGEPYPGGIEKDFILHRSYRCPQKVLMLAHAIGLGLYNERGCLQMLEDKSSWEAIGYEIKQGELKKGEQVILYRDPANSPNPIAEIYSGSQELVKTEVFPDRSAEFDWIADSIRNEIEVEKVKPEQIVVICLDILKMKEILPAIQKRLFERDIRSTIPGLTDNAATFNDEGKVTLTTIFRSKGNEAAIVYICNFEKLYDYVEAIQNRNRAFTAISRSKGWVRITGCGKNMKKAQEEIQKILADLPQFKFTFPDMEIIRRLDATTDKRRREVKKAEGAINSLVNLDIRTIEALAENNPHLIEDLLKRLTEVQSRENH